jgi:hypothetical protein
MSEEELLGIVIERFKVSRRHDRVELEWFEVLKETSYAWIYNLVQEAENVKDETRNRLLAAKFARQNDALGYYFAFLFEWRYNIKVGLESEYRRNAIAGGCVWAMALRPNLTIRSPNPEFDLCQVFSFLFFLLLFCLFTRVIFRKRPISTTPWLLQNLGLYYAYSHHERDETKYFACISAAAELGWQPSLRYVAAYLAKGAYLRYGEEGRLSKDVAKLKKAILLDARAEKFDQYPYLLQNVIAATKRALKKGESGMDLNQICFTFGYALYWEVYYPGSIPKRGESRPKWWYVSPKKQKFGERCIDYYCNEIKFLQKSVFLFLLYWNQQIGIKGPGQMIAQMVWEERGENPIFSFYLERKRNE